MMTIIPLIVVLFLSNQPKIVASAPIHNPLTTKSESDFSALIHAQNQSSNAWHRLQSGMQIPAVNNAHVTVQLQQYVKYPTDLRQTMARARPVLTLILDEIEARQLPTELALLPIVESAYRPYAYSPEHAAGMWQIIPSTARFLGLKQNWWYDGRRDLVKSTKAALTYLESLSRQFDGDWELALAAYNAGPGAIRKAIRHNQKRGKQTSFWQLTRIGRETRTYVPKLLALKTLFSSPETYGIDLLPIDNHVKYELVKTGSQIDLALVAKMAGIPIQQLQRLNPAFNRWATPPNGPHHILLPSNKSAQFKQALQTLPAEKRINSVKHQIKYGDTLSQLAQQYRTTIALIQDTNKISGTRIHAGESLIIPTAMKAESLLIPDAPHFYQ